MLKLLLQFKGKVLNQYITNDTHITIGRNPDNIIQINNQSVSKYHAIIIKEKDKVIIEDLQSTNGTYINEKQIHQEELKDGDEIFIGKHTIKIFLHNTNDPQCWEDTIDICKHSTIVMPNKK
ncbi:MAG: FHA domain-containing protein [bacterium]